MREAERGLAAKRGRAGRCGQRWAGSGRRQPRSSGSFLAPCPPGFPPAASPSGPEQDPRPVGAASALAPGWGLRAPHGPSCGVLRVLRSPLPHPAAAVFLLFFSPPPLPRGCFVCLQWPIKAVSALRLLSHEFIA